MEIVRIKVVAMACLLILPGCSRFGRVIGYADEEDLQGPEVPSHMMSRPATADGLARVTVEGGTAPPQGGRSAMPGGPPVGGFTPEEDIVWTDPDNPDAELPGLEETLAVTTSSRGPWMESFANAKKIAMREGKPVLVWFTDTQRSPLCPFLSAELFSKPQFGDWAGEHLVRVRLDFNVKGTEDDRLRKQDYLEKLKKRYKASGLPTVLVMAPDGTVTGRYRGYKRGDPEFYWGRIKNATIAAEKHHQDWRVQMEKKGYRDWKDRKGRPLFAKLLAYRDGEMILVEPDGRKARAKEKNLSDPDRLWIANEKAKRGR